MRADELLGLVPTAARVAVRDERCRHEMLPGQCSICRRLPYEVQQVDDDPEPDVPEVYALEPTPNDDTTPPPLRWFPSESFQVCTNCNRRIGEGQPCAWVPELDGLIGSCCKTEVV